LENEFIHKIYIYDSIILLLLNTLVLKKPCEHIHENTNYKFILFCKIKLFYYVLNQHSKSNQLNIKLIKI